MSSSSPKEKSLLGKKHKKEEEKEENSLKNSKEEKEESDSEKSNSSSSQEDDKPVKSIFGEKESGFKSEGLFPTKSENKESLFGKSPNFSSEKKGAFGDLSNPIKRPVSLFGSSNDNIIKKESSLFGSGLFNFNSNDNNKDEKKDSKSEEEEEDNNIGQSNSPNYYNPEKETEKDKENNTNSFKKIYVKRIDDLYTLNKEKQKYISKGNGYISIEIKKDNDNKKFAVLMYRNLIGNIILEGIFNEKINKFDSYEKKFKYIAHLIVIVKENDDKEKNKISICDVKIPFMKNEELKLFENKYNETIKFINNEIDDIKKD